MREIILHEVATPLHVDIESWDSQHQANDESYRNYTRFLRGYDRIAWYHHNCSYCSKSISPGDYYEAHVYVSKQHGHKSRVWVEKRHYPECPERLRDLEEEMRREWEKEDRKREATERQAA